MPPWTLLRPLAGSSPAALLGLLISTSPGAQNAKLNDPLAPEARAGSVANFLVTHAGTRAVYVADREEALRNELFSRPLDGSAPSLKLNGTLAVGGDVDFNFTIGAGDRVVYVADESADQVWELFSVPADGSTSRIRISQAGQSSVNSLALTPAGTHAVFLDGPYAAGELNVVPIDGSAAPMALATGFDVASFRLSPDGSLMVFVVPTGISSESLYAVPTDGSAAPLFLTQTHPLAGGGQDGFVNFRNITFSPDDRVVYNELDDDWGATELKYSLYSVPLDASTTEVLLMYGDYGGQFVVGGSALAPRVVFLTYSTVESVATDGTLGATLTPAGWNPTPFSLPLILGTDVLFAAHDSSAARTLLRAPLDGSQPAAALFTPSSESVRTFVLANPTTLAIIRESSSQARRLEALPLAGGTPLPLHPALPSSRGPTWVFPHPGGQLILFLGDNDAFDVNELYSVPLDASSAPVKLNPPLLSDEDVRLQGITPDATHVAFVAGRFASALDLLRVPVDASALPLQLNELVPIGGTAGDVTAARLTPDGGRLVYRADQEIDEEFGLYALDPSAPGVPILLTPDLPTTLAELAFSPLNDRVVFQTQWHQFELRAADLAGGPPVQLDSAPQAFPAPFEVSSDGARVVYRRVLSGSNHELRSVALDGLSAPVVLHAPLAAGRTVSQFDVGASGLVAFLSDLAQDEVFELYSVPIGGGTPVRLNRTLVGAGDVTAFQVDPSGARAVYLADARTDNQFEIFSVPLDGSFAPARLNGRLVDPGDVTDFAIDSGGRMVVYRADQVADGRFDLFSVPVLGARPAHASVPGGVHRPRVTCLTRLTGARSVQPDWVISPDGTQVVYRANPNAVAKIELFRAPVDGSMPPVQLSAPMVTNGGALSFAIAPDQSRVIYLADQLVDTRNELFSVPFGGGAVVQLVLMPATGDVSAFRISPDSADVAFLADRDADEVLELFRVPADGSAAAVQVNLTLPASGDVEADFLVLNGGTIYRADQETNDVVELFLGQ